MPWPKTSIPSSDLPEFVYQAFGNSDNKLFRSKKGRHTFVGSGGIAVAIKYGRDPNGYRVMKFPIAYLRGEFVYETGKNG